MWRGVKRARSSMPDLLLRPYTQMRRPEPFLPCIPRRLIAVFISANLLAGCAETVDSRVISGLATTASVSGWVDEPTIRSLFGINETNFTRVAVPDEYGSYSYRAIGTQPLEYVGVDNLPHYAGGGTNQQQISVGLPEGTCITPDMVKNQTSRSYGPYIYAVEHLPRPGPGYFTFERGGAAFQFPNGRLVMSLDANCSRQLKTEKGW